MIQVTLPYKKLLGVPSIQVRTGVQHRYLRAFLLSKLTGLLGIRKDPLDLDQVCQWMGLEGRENYGSRFISLNHVIGILGSCNQYDRRFRPKEITGSLLIEWEDVGTAILMGAEMPVLNLYKWGEGLFVLYEAERSLVSVLKAFGIKRISAHIVGPITAKTAPPTIEGLAYWEREIQRTHSNS